MGLFDTNYDDINGQAPRRPGLTAIPRASEASIPGQPSVPGTSRTLSRDRVPEYGNEGRGITAGQYSNVVSQALPGAAPSTPASSTFASRMADRQAQRDAAYGSSPGGRDAEAERVNGIYAREAAIRGLDSNGDPLKQLDSRRYSDPIRTSIRERDQAEWDRSHMQGELSSIIHDLRVKNTTRSLASAAQLGQVLDKSLSAPEEMAVRRAQIERNGELAQRGQDAGLLESDARNKTGLSLGRMRDATDQRGQDLANALGLQRDTTDRRGQDMAYGSNMAKAGAERYNSLLKGIDDYFVTTDDKGRARPDPVAKASFLRQAGSTGALEKIGQLPLAQQGPAMAQLLAQHDLQSARGAADPNAPATNQPLRLERGSDTIGPFDVMRETGLGVGDMFRGLNPFNNAPGGYGYVSTPPDPTTGTQASRIAVPLAGLNADQRQAAEWLNRRDK